MKRERGDIYQIVLIFSGLLVTALFSIFLYREIFPEYKIYQKDYVKLEEFRSTYTGQPLPPFSFGVKQIVLEREDKGPPVVDRCVSCHVALEIPAFSPTKIVRDSEGKIAYDKDGNPELVPNEEYIWKKLDQAIADLRDEKVNENLRQHGEESKVKERLAKASDYEALKTAEIGENKYDVRKVLAMHPLMGKETRPFEFHPVQEYGCTSCHNGNGNGLTTEKAHGPVFDGHYEIEFVGPVPKFLETDSANDPRFSRVFNGKPGHELLFQTTPIYVGSLIQAKCVQCHQTTQQSSDSNIPTSLSPLLQKEIDGLTTDYQQGRTLFLEQACYACHKIAGLSRGGVGPELTNEGNAYPWYIKQKIVWPQSDLKTSTMPNMHLDHDEIEDLMTFLLAQKGASKAVGAVPYKASVQAWEAGGKLPWEQPIPPAQIFDLRYSMTVFTIEGCAACHRLKGFESNVGYAIEKQKPSFDQLYNERNWFQKLFPEIITGSEIVSTIETHAKEIDEKIVDGVREHAILEEIEEKYPKTLESFYSPFKYALRAKNHASKNEAELNQWKERVQRIMKMFIQEYGLGRLICPRPNWSGIYRSDEWLMEHFRNPSSHVPRSLMPVFPFDETKFYALTYMLDVLGVRNRDAIQQIWENRGFNPELAFQTHCSQCHGELRQGNGPVSEWIYPIPKNLTSGDFLRNLTKENAMISIHHGVKGTPMPPWGEVAQDKPMQVKEMAKSRPVLTEAQIKQLVDWLFASLSGEQVIKTEQDVLKWQYTPEEAVKELKNEGNVPNLQEHRAIEPSEVKRKADVAALESIPPSRENEIGIEDVFDEKANPIPDEENKTLYYIKKKYYTEHNVLEGQKFFLSNCAVCHGAEGDGSGNRAATMAEAKPRMLSNLNWIRTRDDLRLLRSIKYGVPGTAMTPWGDFTSSLQRMQLVMFIRSLSEEQDQRDTLNNALYETYATALQTIDEARLSESRLIQQYEKEFNESQAQQQELSKQAEQGKIPPAKALKAYEKHLAVGKKLNEEKAIDQALLDLKNDIRQERDIYQGLGIDLINRSVGPDVLQTFIEMIKLNVNRYAVEKDKLVFKSESDSDKKILSLQQKITQELDRKVSRLEKEQLTEEGKIASAERSERLKEIVADIASYKALKNKIVAGVEAAIKLKNKQKAEVKKIVGE